MPIAVRTTPHIQVFSTVIEANYIAQAEAADLGLTEDDIRKIRELAKDPRIGDKIINRYVYVCVFACMYVICA